MTLTGNYTGATAVAGEYFEVECTSDRVTSNSEVKLEAGCGTAASIVGRSRDTGPMKRGSKRYIIDDIRAIEHPPIRTSCIRFTCSGDLDKVPPYKVSTTENNVYCWGALGSCPEP